MVRLSKLVMVALACMAVLTACNTVKGVGKDVQKAGEVIEGAGSK
ncbi:entericidin A/B family lipoprotein [Thermomonas sp. HDW16]|nr:entericidin A/B family lipoprotein [Thermomonas sp. HDW16]